MTAMEEENIDFPKNIDLQKSVRERIASVSD